MNFKRTPTAGDGERRLDEEKNDYCSASVHLARRVRHERVEGPCTRGHLCSPSGHHTKPTAAPQRGAEGVSLMDLRDAEHRQNRVATSFLHEG
jgi:hypothetical protein